MPNIATGGVLGRPKIKPARHIPALVIHSPNTAVEETSQSDRKRTRQEQSASDGGDVLQQRTPALSSDSLLLPHSEGIGPLRVRAKPVLLTRAFIPAQLSCTW